MRLFYRTLFAIRMHSDHPFLAASIRNRLTALKKDRGEYIKPSDVNQLYQAIVKQGRFDPAIALSICIANLTFSQSDAPARGLANSLASCPGAASWHGSVLLVTRLNEVRDDHTTYNNRLDTTLADVFNLLSLFFLTIGRTRECPATYSQIASMRVSHFWSTMSAGDYVLFWEWTEMLEETP